MYRFVSFVNAQQWNEEDLVSASLGSMHVSPPCCVAASFPVSMISSMKCEWEQHSSQRACYALWGQCEQYEHMNNVLLNFCIYFLKHFLNFILLKRKSKLGRFFSGKSNVGRFFSGWASYPLTSEGRQNENHNHGKLTKLITWTTALCNSMKL